MSTKLKISKAYGIPAIAVAITFLAALTACQRTEVAIAEASWPKSDPEVTISESRLTALQLRLLAVELNQEFAGRSNYFFEFLPRLGRIEARVQFKDIQKNSVGKPEKYSERLKEEIKLIEAGIADALSLVSMREGFDSKSHLEIRFEGLASEEKNIAIYRGGEILWY